MTALRSLGVAPEAWTRSRAWTGARGVRARERARGEKGVSSTALRAHPDKRRGGASEVGDAFEAAAAAYETARETTMTARRRADASSRPRANVCDGVTAESFVIDRARGSPSRRRRTPRRAALSDGTRRSVAAVRDDDGDEDDSNAKPSNEERARRARCAL